MPRLTDFIFFQEYQAHFTLSPRGKRVLMHNGFYYRQNSGVVTDTKSKISKIRWRCSHTISTRYACTAKATTISRDGFETATFRGVHSHERKY